VAVEYASEYRYSRRSASPHGRGRDLAVGETRTTLEALRAARPGRHPVLGIVNVVGSTIAREATVDLPARRPRDRRRLHQGVHVADRRAGRCSACTSATTRLARGGARSGVPAQPAAGPLTRTLALEPQVRALGARVRGPAHLSLFRTRLEFPVGLEGALKLKEISYIHAEGYPAAEMKQVLCAHRRQMPVVFVAPRTTSSEGPSNMQEVKARGGHIIALTTEGNGDWAPGGPSAARSRDGAALSAGVTTAAAAALAYHIAVLRGCDVDQPATWPRALTVE